MIFIFLMATAFLGYVLAWGQMSFWGATVITNLFSILPNLIIILVGGFYVSNATLKRFFGFHFLLPFIILGFVITHLYYLHYSSSYNPLDYNINNLITFYPNILIKDFLTLWILGIGYTLQIFLASFNLTHPDNSYEVTELITPLHIVPEWYFLHLYIVLKSIPHKTSGLSLFTCNFLILYLLGEVKNISTITRLTSYNWISSNLFICYFISITMCILFIGSQLPQNLFLSYGRVCNVFNFIFVWSNLWFPYHPHILIPEIKSTQI